MSGGFTVWRLESFERPRFAGFFFVPFFRFFGAWAADEKDKTEARQKYKAALKNYLWNIVVFYNQKAEYAKALLYAGRCWQKLGQDTRAQELYRELRRKFGSTKWAGMIGK